MCRGGQKILVHQGPSAGSWINDLKCRPRLAKAVSDIEQNVLRLHSNPGCDKSAIAMILAKECQIMIIFPRVVVYSRFSSVIPTLNIPGRQPLFCEVINTKSSKTIYVLWKKWCLRIRLGDSVFSARAPDFGRYWSSNATEISWTRAVPSILARGPCRTDCADFDARARLKNSNLVRSRFHVILTQNRTSGKLYKSNLIQSLHIPFIWKSQLDNAQDLQINPGFQRPEKFSLGPWCVTNPMLGPSILHVASRPWYY